MKTSLIISVYKNVTDLRVVLDALKYQTVRDFEVVISEDGESEEMRSFLGSYSFPGELLHLTQADEGWRKNKALNNAVRKASGDYLIFIDGDCVLHHRFIENHLRYADPKRILGGKRVKLGPAFSDMFRGAGMTLPQMERFVTSQPGRVKKDGARFFEEAFYCGSGLLSIIPAFRRMRELKGCNMSFFREAIVSINGFDEDYVRPAIGEDIDLTWRFKGMGYSLFSLRNRAVQYHLWHKENWTDQSLNIALMERKREQNQYRCLNGLTNCAP